MQQQSVSRVMVTQISSDAHTMVGSTVSMPAVAYFHIFAVIRRNCLHVQLVYTLA